MNRTLSHKAVGLWRCPDPKGERGRGCGRDDRGAQRRHHLAERYGLVRPKGRRDRLRLLLRELEEARKDVGAVLGREDLPELDDAGQAKPAISEGLDDLGEPLDELGGGLPVEGGALREAELAVQEVEERGVAELEPEPSPVEVRQLHEELAECGTLASEEVGKTGGEVACGGHSESFARVFEASPDARIRSWTRERGREARPPSGAPGARHTSSPRARRGVPACRAGPALSVSKPVKQRMREDGVPPMVKRGSPRADLVMTVPARGDAPAAALVVAEPGATKASSPSALRSPGGSANDRTA